MHKLWFEVVRPDSINTTRWCMRAVGVFVLFDLMQVVVFDGAAGTGTAIVAGLLTLLFGYDLTSSIGKRTPGMGQLYDEIERRTDAGEDFARTADGRRLILYTDSSR